MREHLSPGVLTNVGQEFLWVALGQAVAAVGGIAAVRFMTHSLNPELYGELALGMTIGSLANQLAFGPIGNALARFSGPALESHSLRVMIGAVVNLSVRTLSLLALVSALIGTSLVLFSGIHWIPLFGAATAFSIFSGVAGICDAFQNAARQRIVAACHLGASHWLRFLLAILLIRYCGPSSTIAMTGYAIGVLVVLTSQTFFCNRYLITQVKDEKDASEKEVRHVRQQMSRYIWPFSAWGIFTWMQLSSDRWSLQTFRPTLEVGLYQSLYQIGYYPILLLSNVCMQLASPIIFTLAGDGRDTKRITSARKVNTFLYVVIIIAAILATAVAAQWHEQVYQLLVPSVYLAASPLLPIMIFAGGMFAAGQAMTTSILCSTDSLAIMPPKLTMAILGILLNLGGAKYYGVSGVVWAQAVSSTIYCMWIMFIQARLAQVQGSHVDGLLITEGAGPSLT